MVGFESINKAYNSVFQVGQLSLGIVVPIERYAQGPVPTMERQLERVQLVEQLGFKAVWVRDVPLNVLTFGDAGQTFDPFTYLGYLAGQTSKIALAIGSVALPLHHPLHVAKSAATIDQLSGGRLLMGIASGDRYEEYPAMGIDYTKRGALFREAFSYIRNAQVDFPTTEANHYGELRGNADALPKPQGARIPMLITGHSRQSLEWNAEHGDGWLYYPRNLQQQEYTITNWRRKVAEAGSYDKPFAQSLYIDLHPDDDFLPQPIHLGFRSGVNQLILFLQHLRKIGVNHVAINLRFNQAAIEPTLERLAKEVIPHFHS